MDGSYEVLDKEGTQIQGATKEGVGWGEGLKNGSSWVWNKSLIGLLQVHKVLP